MVSSDSDVGCTHCRCVRHHVEDKVDPFRGVLVAPLPLVILKKLMTTPIEFLQGNGWSIFKVWVKPQVGQELSGVRVAEVERSINFDIPNRLVLFPITYHRSDFVIVVEVDVGTHSMCNLPRLRRGFDQGLDLLVCCSYGLR